MTSGHGHAATMATRPFLLHLRPAVGPNLHGMVHMRSAAINTGGAQSAANLSTVVSVCDLFRFESSTSRERRATVDSPLGAVVLMTIRAGPELTAPPGMLSPEERRTGRDSPVMVDSSKVVAPATMIPSHGTFSPTGTETAEPTATVSAGTLVSSSPSPSSSRRRAVPGPRSRATADSASSDLEDARPSRTSETAKSDDTAAASA
mmetsp:Transcript_10789/g.31948  ORF Transcript_10789/g.31948 Transcript_10789/m.31948 type:complete len:205 (-) Transcript_10789:647-1261(-)